MMIRNFFVLIFLSLTFTSACQAQTPITAQRHAELRAAMDRNDLASAEKILREFQTKHAQAFVKNNYDYLLARILDRQSNGKDAAPAYQKVISRNSIFAGYALGHLAEISRDARDFKGEQNYLSQLVGKFPAQLNAESARKRLGTSHFQNGNYAAAIATLQPISGLSGSFARESTARIGEAQLAMKQNSVARSTFESLINGGKDDASLRAILGLDKIDLEAKTPITELEHLRRARVLQFNRAFAEARPHWLAIINDFASASRAEAAYETGRGFQWEDNFRDAAKYFQMAYDISPRSEEGEQGFYYVGHCHQYLNEADRAVARYSEFIQLFPRSKFFGYAYLNAIDSLRAVGKLTDALDWARRTQTETRDPFIQVTGLFQQARIHLSQNDFASALADLTALRMRNLGARGLVAGTNVTEVNFLRAYCLEQLGRFDEAINEYLTFTEGRNGATGYYGQRATARLRELAGNQRANKIVATKLAGFITAAREANTSGIALTAKTSANQALRLVSDDATRNEMLNILRTAYTKLPGYGRIPVYTLTPAGRLNPLGDQEPAATGNDPRTLANEFLFLGLYDEGAPLLAASGLVTDAYSLAVYFERGDNAARALNFIEPQFNGVPDDYRPELMPRATAELMYPNPYHDVLTKHALPRNVNPFFVHSIARQESRFDAKVKSPAAARGLLQFISSTSSEIAKQLNLTDFEQDDLYNPNQAILIGSQYMKNLFDELKHPANVAAAYNGSEQSVRRWVARSKSTDVDRHVIEVGKRETKDYVYKVMNNLWVYQALYR